MGAVTAPPISFRTHEVRTGSIDGARADFEQMIGQLVRASTPAVRVVSANPGDWGIDVFIGSLADEIVVWQSKYFIDGIGPSQQQQIRESLKSLLATAGEKGFAVRRWVLCIPVSMDGPTTLWWDRWRKKAEKTHGIEIDLWDETELITLLISPDAEDVRAHYYSAGMAPVPGEDLPVCRLTIQSGTTTLCLSVRCAKPGDVELASCKEQFFNAEIVAREIHDKGVPEEERALIAADAQVHAIWEARFSEACERNHDRRLPGLHRSVMADVRAERPSLPRVLRLGPLHAMGLAHRTVEDGRAGWVRDFRRVAAEHRAGSCDRDDTLDTGPAHAEASVT